MWRAARAWLRSASERAAGRTLVGEDASGNRYFLEKDGEQVKRVMTFATSHPDPADVPAEWASWLHHRRPDAPSQRECELIAYRREQLAEKVAQIEAADQRLRLEEQAAKDAASAEQQAQVVEDAEAGEPSGSGDTFRVGSWDPSAPQEAESEPSGAGASFRVGTWSPGEDAEATRNKQ